MIGSVHRYIKNASCCGERADRTYLFTVLTRCLFLIVTVLGFSRSATTEYDRLLA